MMLSQNPHIVSVALGIIANYATEIFKAEPRGMVKLSIVLEKRPKSECLRIDYVGPAEGLATIDTFLNKALEDAPRD